MCVPNNSSGRDYRSLLGKETFQQFTLTFDSSCCTWLWPRKAPFKSCVFSSQDSTLVLRYGVISSDFILDEEEEPEPITSLPPEAMEDDVMETS